MDVQGVFYIVAIVFMIMWVVVLTLASVVLWELYTIIKNAPQRIQAAIDAKISEVVENAKSGFLGTFGISAATFFFSKFKKFFLKS